MTDYTVIVEAKAQILESAFEDVRDTLGEDSMDEDDLRYAWGYAKLQYNQFNDVKLKQLEFYLKNGNTDDCVDLERRAAHFVKNFFKLQVQVDKKLPPIPAVTGSDSSQQSSATAGSAVKIILPNRELPQFTGEVRDWLPFWATFSDIDSNGSLTEIDKFHYLIQSTKDGSAARKLLTSFPFSGANYQPAKTALEERYGRPSVLVKVYIRDLLQLVIEASTGKAQDFAELVTTITSQIRNLESLGVTQDKCAQVLYPVVESCLPSEVLQAWQRSAAFREELSELIKFLQAEVNNHTERKLAHFRFTDGGNGGNKSPKQKNKSGDVPTTSSFYNNSSDGRPSGNGKKQKEECAFCDRGHRTVDCRNAMGMTYQSKIEALRAKHVCFNCLRRAKHMAAECGSKPKCSVCGRQHFTVICSNLDFALHKESPPQEMKQDGQPTTAAGSQQPSGNGTATTTSCSNQTRDTDVPLQTLLVTAHGDNGRKRVIRAVLDSASQKSYILKSIAADLQLSKVGEETVIHELFGGVQSEVKHHDRVKVHVCDLLGQNDTNFDVSTTDKISTTMMTPPGGPWMEQFARQGITFTDARSSASTTIGMLIGNDLVGRIYTSAPYDLGYGPTAINTRWGWVLTGKLPRDKKVPKGKTSHELVKSLINVEGHPLSALWDLEVIGIEDPAKKENKKELEEATQEYFNSTTVQLGDGRYQVSLPWIHSLKEKLPSNYNIAKRRLQSTTKDLQTKGFLKNYHVLLQQWLEDELIEEVPISELDDFGHYLPHRAVVKLSSSTTPIRPVFDGSAKMKGQLSLNECLDKGPNTLEMIPQILTRFRRYKFGVLADIKRAFQQIAVDPADRNFLRFLWWEDDNCEKVKVLRHSRVVFGVTCSPYLLGATLRHHLSKTLGEDVEVATQLLSSIYVDNTVHSVSSMEEAQKFEKTATSLLRPAQFDLRGWEFGPAEDGTITSVLGMKWNMKTDTLALDVSRVNLKIQEKLTLRHVLSLVHSIYDPLGLASPFTILGKLLLRRCHNEKAGLDKPLPDDLAKEVIRWASQIPQLSELEVPRHIHYGSDAQYSLHVLCDSSQQATAACVFLRVEENTTTRVFMIGAKNRVAPKVKVTIPRLELVACVIAARLAHTVVEYLENPDIPVTFWSDSSTALAWIRGTGPWGVFVSNSVQKIKAITKVDCWRHVPGKINTADLPSRGCSVKKLLESRWWEGPEWLRQPSTTWHFEEVPDEDLVDTERKKIVKVMTAVEYKSPFDNFLRISDYPRMLKAIAYWLKFKKILMKQYTADKRPGKPTVEEINEAEIELIKYVQQQFRDSPEKIKMLQPFTDKMGLVRVTTRLMMEEEDFMHPILLPEKNEFVKRIIRWEHDQNCHVGVTLLLSIMRQKFWIVNGRRTVRGVLTKCWVCRRFTARRIEAPEAPLPSARTELGIPFSTTGVDAAGPLFLKGGGKSWILLFTCATYRAVHLELVDTLTTDGFIRALRKFVADKGRPNILYSDNGRGFVAANKVFQKLDWSKIEEYAKVKRIEWRFNPPSSPWWGGWWERLIGLAKQLIRRILGRRVVTREELELLLCEVANLLNSRPLTYVSENPDDPVPLTPNHFIKLSGLTVLPEADLHDAKSTRKTYKKLQRLREALRSRFRKEYLGFLRGKFNSKRSPELKPGDVVMIEKENTKRQDWPLGVIQEAIAGRDGIKRLFRIKTRSGEFMRPAQRLYPLEQEV